MLLKLLNKKDILSLSILSTLESKQKLIPIQSLSQDLKVSEYHVRSGLDQLILDEKRLGLPIPLFKIEILDNKMIQYTRCSSLSAYNYLRYIYANESNFMPFFQNFLFEKSRSQVDFFEDNFLSKTSFFRLRKQFKATLNLFDIDISSDVKLIGKEQHIRSFLYLYLLTTTGDIEIPFSNDFISQSDKLINAIAVTLKLQFSNADTLKLQYYLYIVFPRHLQQHPLPSKNNYSQDAQLDKLAEILTSFFAFDSVSEGIATAIELRIFLYSEGMITLLPVPDQTLLVINLIREKFIHYFNIDDDMVDILFNHDVNTNLAQFLTHVSHFNYHVNLLSKVEKINFLDDNFYEYKRFSQDIINLLPKYYANRQKFISRYHTSLVTDFLLFIVSNFNLSQLTKPILVTIDFTYGHTYTKLIENEISKFSGLNIVTTKHLSDKTDILISNLSPQTLPTVHKLQWTSPPTSSDWAFLGNLIIDIKKKRQVTDETIETK